MDADASVVVVPMSRIERVNVQDRLPPPRGTDRAHDLVDVSASHEPVVPDDSDPEVTVAKHSNIEGDCE